MNPKNEQPAPASKEESTETVQPLELETVIGGCCCCAGTCAQMQPPGMSFSASFSS